MLLLFILCALRSGSDRYYLMKTQSTRVKGSEVFYYLNPKRSISLLRFYFNYYLRKLLYIFLCFLPSLLTALLLYCYLKYSRASLYVSTVIFFAVLVLIFNGIVYFFRLNAFLFASRYYFASGNFNTYRELFRFSARCIEGKRWVVTKKRLGFFGWFLSCLLIFPTFFVQNYYRESMALLAGDLMKIQYLQK